jgi:hypothetical protein
MASEFFAYRQDGRATWTQVSQELLGKFHGDLILHVVQRLIKEGKTDGIIRADDGPLYFWATQENVGATLRKVGREHPYRRNPYKRSLG